MSRSERNRKGRREQPVGFLNVRVEDSKLFEEEEEEKESISYAFTRGFKLGCGRSVRFTVSDRLLNFAVSFRLCTRMRYTTPF